MRRFGDISVRLTGFFIINHQRLFRGAKQTFRGGEQRAESGLACIGAFIGVCVCFIYQTRVFVYVYFGFFVIVLVYPRTTAFYAVIRGKFGECGFDAVAILVACAIVERRRARIFNFFFKRLFRRVRARGIKFRLLRSKRCFFKPGEHRVPRAVGGFFRVVGSGAESKG